MTRYYCTNLSISKPCARRTKSGECRSNDYCEHKQDICLGNMEMAEFISKQNMGLFENQKAIFKQNEEIIGLLQYHIMRTMNQGR